MKNVQSEFLIISIANQKLTANCFLEIFGGILAFNYDAATLILLFNAMDKVSTALETFYPSGCHQQTPPLDHSRASIPL